MRIPATRTASLRIGTHAAAGQEVQKIKAQTRAERVNYENELAWFSTEHSHRQLIT